MLKVTFSLREFKETLQVKVLYILNYTNVFLTD